LARIPLNKTMDRGDLDLPEARPIVTALDDLIRELAGRGLRVSSWYGSFELPEDMREWERLNRGEGYEPLPGAADDASFPWFLYWEIAWLELGAGFAPGQRVLDLGGSSSLFSYYLASRGIEVVTIDLAEELVANANEVAAAAGWPLQNLVMDIGELHVDGPFDHVTSVCVFEHVPVSTRVEMSSRVRELLRPGGTFAITFDYGNPSRLARISTASDVREQFVEPSGLSVRGNEEFHDNGLRYLLHPFLHPATSEKRRARALERGMFLPGDEELPGEYTFGALFLEREG
jgi:2-polyprenyl-3-methyl-5-hydroxy-6-metoxy-1,4-benzoquinol methylase